MIVVSRIEENIAVVYFGDRKEEIPLRELPEGTHEGSVLKETPQGLVPDPEAENQRRSRISGKMRRLFK